MNSSELSSLFFSELKQYNKTNYKELRDATFKDNDPSTYKACSSVVTRFFIFAEKHPEISQADLKLVYYKLRIDLIAHYFAEYPAASLDNLRPFQEELIKHDSKIINEAV